MAEDGFLIAKAFVSVEPDTEDFPEKLKAALDEAVAGVDAKVKVGLDDTDLEAGGQRARATVADLDKLTAYAAIGLDDAELDAGADDAKAKVADLDKLTAYAALGLDKDEFDVSAEDAEARLDDLGSKRADPSLGLDDDEFEAKLARDREQLASVGAESGEGSLIGALSLGVGSLLPGVGGAVAGLGALGATGVLALGGVSKALEAHSQASQTVGTTAAQSAATAFSNSVAMQQAQQAVAQAYQQAAEASSESADQIESAQSSLTSVVRNAAASQIAAEQAVGQAEHQLGDAQYAEQQAQENLTNARIQARLTLQQLNDAQKDSVLNVRAARDALAEAQYQQQLTDENANSDALDREQASLAVAQAQRQLIEAEQGRTNATAAANRADADGVEGSQSVVQAKQAVRDAIYAVRQAEQQQANAARNLTDTELNNAQQIKQAQLAVTQAEQQAAYQQEQSAQAIQQAVRNVTDTQKEQQLQAAATASTSNKAASQYAADMAGLTPAARRFVRELLGMRGALHSLEADAQRAVLPGLSAFLRDARGDLPEVERGVSAMGKLISTAFAGMGRELSSAGGKDVLSGLLANGNAFVKTVLPPFGHFVADLARLGSQKGAQSGLAALLAGVGNGLTGAVKGIAPYTRQINQFLEAAGHIVSAIGPPLGRIVGLIAETLSPISRYLNSHPNGTVVKVIGDIVAGLLAFKGLQKIVFEPFGKLFSGISSGFTTIRGIPGKISKAWEGTGQVATKVFGDGGAVEQAAGKISGWFGPAWKTVSTRAGAVWESIEGGVGTAAGTVARWGEQFSGMIGTAAGTAARFATGLASGIGSAVSGLITNIGELSIVTKLQAAAQGIWNGVMVAFDAISDAGPLVVIPLIVAAVAALTAGVIYAYDHFTWFRDGVQDVFKSVSTQALWLWHEVFDPVWRGIEAGATFLYNDVLQPVFRGMTQQFQLVENAALWLWHNVMDPMWQGIQDGARDFERGFAVVWDKLEAVFKTPVNFLIQHVYDDGIRRLWDDVVTHIGLSSLKLPEIPALAGGGIVPGQDTGRDNQLVAMRSGEGVLVPGAVAAIGGPSVVHALNNAHGGHSSTQSGPGAHFSGGGIFGSLGHMVGDALSDIGSLADPAQAITKLLSRYVSTSAAGDLGKIMEAIPKTLIGSLAKALGMSSESGSGSGGSGGGGGYGVGSPTNPTGSVKSWFEQAIQVTRTPASWLTDLETIGYYESGDNPDAINNWDSNAAAGDPSRGIMQVIGTTFAANHQPGTSDNIYNPVANIAAAIRYIKGRYGSVADVPGIISLAEGHGYVGYDSGGWLMPSTMPGAPMPVNLTGKPEAVLTPDESQAVKRWATQLATGGDKQVQVVNNWYGPQMPTPEMLAQMDVRLTLALSGG